MSIASLATLQQKLRRPHQRMDIVKLNGWASGTNLSTTWADNGLPAAGTAPTTAAAPTRSTTGALGQKNKVGTALRAVLRRAQTIVSASAAFNPGFVLLVDRLSHQGGLSGTTTGAQTTNLPTAALTRYTNGIGVWAALEIYTTIGTSGATVTASYTNSDSTSGRTTQAVPFGVSGYSGQRCLVPLCVASGDKGVKSVESVTLSGSTGSAGNFGVTLYKTLAAMPSMLLASMPRDGNPLPWLGDIPEIQDDACLMLLTYGPGQVTTYVPASIDFIED